MKTLNNQLWNDKEIKIINESTASSFEVVINSLLQSGDWRVMETEMSVTDHLYCAMLVRRENENR